MATSASGAHFRQRLLRYIQQFTALHGYPPSYQEMALAFGRTKSTICDHLHTLCRQGLLLRAAAHRSRALRLTQPDPNLPAPDTLLQLPLRSWEAFEKDCRPDTPLIAHPIVPLPAGTWMPRRRRR